MPDLLRQHYLGYLTTLSERRLDDLGAHVAEALLVDGAPTTLAGYRADRRREVEVVPDLRWSVLLLVVEGTPTDGLVAARLRVDGTPVAPFLGHAPTGRHLSFVEHVFYLFRDGRIVAVDGLLDVAGVARSATGGADGG